MCVLIFPFAKIAVFRRADSDRRAKATLASIESSSCFNDVLDVLGTSTASYHGPSKCFLLNERDKVRRTYTCVR